jgi:hypothetical protein
MTWFLTTTCRFLVPHSLGSFLPSLLGGGQAIKTAHKFLEGIMQSSAISSQRGLFSFRFKKYIGPTPASLLVARA